MENTEKRLKNVQKYENDWALSQSYQKRPRSTKKPKGWIFNGPYFPFLSKANPKTEKKILFSELQLKNVRLQSL